MNYRVALTRLKIPLRNGNEEEEERGENEGKREKKREKKEEMMDGMEGAKRRKEEQWEKRR